MPNELNGVNTDERGVPFACRKTLEMCASPETDHSFLCWIHMILGKADLEQRIGRAKGIK